MISWLYKKFFFNQKTTLASGILFCPSLCDNCCCLLVNIKENKKDIDKLGVSSVEGHHEQLRCWDLSSLEKIRLWGDLTAAPGACKGISEDMEPGSSQWCVVGGWEAAGTSRSKRGSGWRWGETFFPPRPAKQRHRLPREVVQSSSFKIFKIKLDKTLTGLHRP